MRVCQWHPRLRLSLQPRYPRNAKWKISRTSPRTSHSSRHRQSPPSWLPIPECRIPITRVGHTRLQEILATTASLNILRRQRNTLRRREKRMTVPEPITSEFHCRAMSPCQQCPPRTSRSLNMSCRVAFRQTRAYTGPSCIIRLRRRCILTGLTRPNTAGHLLSN